MNPVPTKRPAGIVNLCKPTGQSSAKYVYRLRPVFGIRKVGHAGTLDPFAEGVLLGCVGQATKLVERLISLPKHYRTTLRLGVTNRTHDPEHPFVPVPGAVPPSSNVIRETVAAFVGEIEQIPPLFSAVKIDGVASYRLARRGSTAALQPKHVRIYNAAVVEYEWPTLRLEIRCGRGTYIRAIARDLGDRLGCGACCETLTRRAVGPFTIEDAISLDSTEIPAIRSALIPIPEALRRIEAASDGAAP